MGFKKTQEQYIKDAIVVHGDAFSYKHVKYTGNKNKIKLKCNKCKHVFNQEANSHTRGAGCPKCGVIKATNLKRYDKNIFIKKSIKVHGDRYDYSLSKYITAFTPLDIICNECNGIFTQKPIGHYRGNGCDACATKRTNDFNTSNTKEFVSKAKKIHGDTYGYDKVVYVKAKLKVIIMCSKHGPFEQQPNNHLTGDGCPICKSSKGEIKIFEYLDSVKIKYIREYKLGDSSFRYDFYLPELNILIEYDGIQHFKPISIFGGQKGFEETRERDKLKNILADGLNIPLIRIPYSKYKNIDSYLKSRLNIIINRNKRKRL